MPKLTFDARPGIRYQRNVAGILRNPAGEILICERVDTPGAWQFPQGGIDPGETPEQALRRELEEEISVTTGYVIVKHDGPYRYIYDEGFSKKGFQGKEQDYFLLEFTGNPTAINLETSHPEFRQCRWIRPEEFQMEWLPRMKRDVYRAVFEDFFAIALPAARN
jgi:putative (di)nucleoside polyphosphate hydrolase